MFKKLLTSSSLLLSLAASAATVEVKQGWNLIGVKSQTQSENIISNQDEVIHYYKNGNWDYFTNTKTGTIDAGTAFWYKSTTSKADLDIGSDTTDKALINSWELVTPTNSMWDLSQKQNVAYAWKHTGGQNGDWQLYHPSYTQTKYETFTKVKQGEGVWLKVSNAMIGNTPVLIQNGDFGLVQKTATTISSEAQLYLSVENLYNFIFSIDSNNTNTSKFLLTMSLKNSSGNQYLFTIDNNYLENKLSVLVSGSSKSLKTTNIVEPFNLLENNTKIKLNFDKIVKYIINNYSDTYSYEDVKNKMTTSDTYDYEVTFTNLDIIGDKNNKVTGKLIIK